MRHRLITWFGQLFLGGRIGLILAAAGFYVVVSGMTRVVLLLLNYSDSGAPVAIVGAVILVGALLDAWVALGITLPLSGLSLWIPDRWVRSQTGKWISAVLLTGGFFGILYLGVVELFFFDEFSSRFNYVAVDYLIYPHEVFVNIWDSYPVPQFLVGTFVLAVAAFWALRRRIRKSLDEPTRWRKRGAALLAQTSIVLVGAYALNINVARISDNRVLNEITANGVHSFLYAAVTNELDYDAFYAQLPSSEAEQRLRRLVATNDATYLMGDSCVVLRRIDDPESEQHLNVVLILEESFGSSFVGALNPDGANCTPHFDTLVSQGMLFSRVYATGNRTVRGIEASLAGLPPIPGQSVVKRPGGRSLFTLPGVFKLKGYNTAFIYGGRSYFDNLGAFARANGFDRVIDQTDFQQNTFSTIWGVCDEDLFDNALAYMDSLHASGDPFFVTLLTVSNHKPYLYPEGRIPYDPQARRREFAVRYADYALDRFLRSAEAHSYFDSTLFVVLGDHGARVYGSMQIPMDSYEIPVLFYAPDWVSSGTRIGRVGSQMDLPSTILDLLNFDYDSEFFGRSLLRSDPGNDCALLSHNRDVALLRNDTLAVLGIRQGRELWVQDPTSGTFRPTDSTAGGALIDDAIAYYQTAYDEYRRGLLNAQALDHPLR